MLCCKLTAPCTHPRASRCRVEGVYGTALMLCVMLPVVQLLPGREGAGVHEDSLDSLCMLVGSRELQVAAGLLVLTMAFYNIAGMLMTDAAGAVTRTVLETLRTLLVWMLNLLLFYAQPMEGVQLGEPWTTHSWMQACGFAILVTGTLAYGAPPRAAVLGAGSLSSCAYSKSHIHTIACRARRGAAGSAAQGTAALGAAAHLPRGGHLTASRCTTAAPAAHRGPLAHPHCLFAAPGGGPGHGAAGRGQLTAHAAHAAHHTFSQHSGAARHPGCCHGSSGSRAGERRRGRSRRHQGWCTLVRLWDCACSCSVGRCGQPALDSTPRRFIQLQPTRSGPEPQRPRLVREAFGVKQQPLGVEPAMQMNQ